MNYQEMLQKFQNGQITTDQWVAFCLDYFNNVIMTDPVVGRYLKNKSFLEL